MIWQFIPGPIRRAVAWAVAGIVGFGLLMIKLRRDWAIRAENKALRGYVETRKATDEVDMGNDAGLVRDGLRKRDPNKR